MDPVSDQQAALVVLVGVGFLAQVASSVATALGAWRRKPSMDKELSEYARRAELVDLERRMQDANRLHDERVERALTEIFNRLNNIQGAMESELRGIAGHLGRLTGLTEGKRHG